MGVLRKIIHVICFSPTMYSADADLPPPGKRVLVCARPSIYQVIGVGPDPSAEKVKKGLHGMVVDALTADLDSTGTIEELAARIVDLIELREPGEYAAEVGEEQFALETREDPYDGPAAVYH
jgi:hypothetical protein